MTNNTTTIIEKLNEYTKGQKELQEKQSEINEQFKNLVNLFSVELFTLVPEVQTVSWTQYTPYFNDGDSCEFRVHDIYFANFVPKTMYSDLAYTLSEEDKKNGQWVYSINSLIKSNILSPDKSSICKSFHNLLYYNDDGLYDMFDDHVIVQITKNGIETEQYEHD